MDELDLVVFDMDGVVFEGRSFWLDLHREYGTVTEALVLAEELTSDYTRVARVTAEQLWKGKPAEPFLRLVRERAYQPGIRAVMRVLAARGVATAIVSSGPSQLAGGRSASSASTSSWPTRWCSATGACTARWSSPCPTPTRPRRAAP